MSMQTFTIHLVPAEGAPVPPVTGKATADAIRDAFSGIRDGMLLIETEGGFVSVQAGAIVSFVSKAEG